jgi:hypothetical protein
MPAISRDEATVEISDGGAELRTAPAGALTVGFVRAPKGTDFRPLLQGLPGDLCQCPHWGYMVKGRVRMHTADGADDYEAGQVFYWPPGHAPEVLEDAEYIDFSPPEEFRPVLDHITGRGAASGA